MLNELDGELVALATSAHGEKSSVAGMYQVLAKKYHFMDHFLRLIFPAGDALVASPRAQPIAQPAPDYPPLPQSKLNSNAGYHLPDATMATRVRMESAAIEVMTDLRRIPAVTVGRFASIDQANRTMIGRGVRTAFVIDDRHGIMGIVTATDVLGGKPVQITQQRGIRHEEVTVRDIMTPVDRLQVIELGDVLKARVGNVIATLKLSGRQHALVVDRVLDPEAGHRQMVRGIFSLTQIARQLDDMPQTLEVGHSFADIAAAIGS